MREAYDARPEVTSRTFQSPKARPRACTRIAAVHFVYIVRCADGTLYTGYARDPHARVRIHNRGRGARYTSGRRPVSLVYWEAFESIGDALRRERQLKRMRRAGKEALARFTCLASAADSCARRPSTGVISRKFWNGTWQSCCCRKLRKRL